MLDLWTVLLKQLFNVPATNWATVERWIGNMPEGQFIQQSMVKAAPIPRENAIGWTADYVIGIGYGLLLACPCSGE